MANSREILGKYRLLREIAKSPNVVYDGMDPELGQKIAVKELILSDTLSELQTQERIARFSHDAKVARSFTHPNIVHVFAVGEDKRRHFMVMEYLEGETLRQSLNKTGSLPVNKAIPIALQVCDGLCYAHLRGVTHGDLKPENIFLLPRGQVKLTDFGAPSETPSYNSPEQVYSRPVDARSDVFSLGVILYEMITGYHPFQGATAEEVSKNITSFAPSMPSGISPGLQTVLERALAKDLQSRYQSIALMAADIRAVKPAAEIFKRPVPQSSGNFIQPARSLGFAAAEAQPVLMSMSGGQAPAAYGQPAFAQQGVAQMAFAGQHAGQRAGSQLAYSPAAPSYSAQPAVAGVVQLSAAQLRPMPAQRPAQFAAVRPVEEFPLKRATIVALVCLLIAAGTCDFVWMSGQNTQAVATTPQVEQTRPHTGHQGTAPVRAKKSVHVTTG